MLFLTNSTDNFILSAGVRRLPFGHTTAILEETAAMIGNGRRWSAMRLDAQNCKEMAHFIAPCGRAL